MVLLVHLNYSFIEIGYCFLSREIIIAPALLAYTFTIMLKYIVHQSSSPPLL